MRSLSLTRRLSLLGSSGILILYAAARAMAQIPGGGGNSNSNSSSGNIANVKNFGAAGNGVSDDTAAIQAAHNAAPVVYYPAGDYKISSTINLSANSSIIGAGSLPTNVGATWFTRISPTTNAFVYSYQAPTGTFPTGPRFRDIHLYCQNGIQINNPANGQPDIPGSQGGIVGTSLKNVSMSQSGTIGTGTGLQISSASTWEVGEQCNIAGFGVNVDVYYNGNPSFIRDSFLWTFGTAAVRITRLDGWGAKVIIEGNAFENGKTGSLAFIDVVSSFDVTIRSNFFEQGPAEGTGMTAAIIFDEVQQALIADNYINMPTACAPNWLKVTNPPSGNLQMLTITGNFLPGCGPASCNAGAGLPIFSNSGHVWLTCTHSGNSLDSVGSTTTGEDGIPINSVAKVQAPPGILALITPNLVGSVSNADWGGNAYIINEEWIVPPAAGGAPIRVVDRLANKGTLTVKALVHATGSITETVYVFDGSTPVVAGIGLVLTTQPKWYTLGTGLTISSFVEVQFYSNVTETIKIKAVSIE
jgi:hypothetical protein